MINSLQHVGSLNLTNELMAFDAIASYFDTDEKIVKQKLGFQAGIQNEHTRAATFTIFQEALFKRLKRASGEQFRAYQLCLYKEPFKETSSKVNTLFKEALKQALKFKIHKEVFTELGQSFLVEKIEKFTLAQWKESQSQQKELLLQFLNKRLSASKDPYKTLSHLGKCKFKYLDSSSHPQKINTSKKQASSDPILKEIILKNINSSWIQKVLYHWLVEKWDTLVKEELKRQHELKKEGLKKEEFTILPHHYSFLSFQALAKAIIQNETYMALKIDLELKKKRMNVILDIFKHRKKPFRSVHFLRSCSETSFNLLLNLSLSQIHYFPDNLTRFFNKGFYLASPTTQKQALVYAFEICPLKQISLHVADLHPFFLLHLKVFLQESLSLESLMLEGVQSTDVEHILISLLYQTELRRYTYLEKRVQALVSFFEHVEASINNFCENLTKNSSSLEAVKLQAKIKKSRTDILDSLGRIESKIKESESKFEKLELKLYQLEIRYRGIENLFVKIDKVEEKQPGSLKFKASDFKKEDVGFRKIKFLEFKELEFERLAQIESKIEQFQSKISQLHYHFQQAHLDIKLPSLIFSDYSLISLAQLTLDIEERSLNDKQEASFEKKRQGSPGKINNEIPEQIVKKGLSDQALNLLYLLIQTSIDDCKITLSNTLLTEKQCLEISKACMNQEYTVTVETLNGYLPDIYQADNQIRKIHKRRHTDRGHISNKTPSNPTEEIERSQDSVKSERANKDVPKERIDAQHIDELGPQSAVLPSPICKVRKRRNTLI